MNPLKGRLYRGDKYSDAGGFTKGRIIVRGRLVARGKATKADFVLYWRRPT
jgi:type I site-specific restriction endonuclease